MEWSPVGNTIEYGASLVNGSVGENVAVLVGDMISLVGELAETDDVDINEGGCRERSLAISCR